MLPYSPESSVATLRANAARTRGTPGIAICNFALHWLLEVDKDGIVDSSHSRVDSSHDRANLIYFQHRSVACLSTLRNNDTLYVRGEQVVSHFSVQIIPLCIEIGPAYQSSCPEGFLKSKIGCYCINIW